MKTKINTNRWIAIGTLSAMTLAAVPALTTPAQASPSGWKKATIGAGVVTAYGLLKHKGKVATVGGVATVGSYLMYRKSKKKEAQRQAWYQRRYGRNWRSHYNAGG